MLIFNWLIFGSIFWTCDAYKILVIFPVPWSSHRILGDSVVKYLLEAGHEVAYITPFPKKTSQQNIRYIDVSANEKYINDTMINLKATMDTTIGVNDVKDIFTNSIELSEQTVMNKNVQNLLKDPSQQFDLVLAEWLYTETYSAFSAVFDCPLIWFSTMETHSMILSLIDEPLNPAYNIGFLNICTLPFTFLQRFEELCNQLIWGFFEHLFMNALTDLDCPGIWHLHQNLDINNLNASIHSLYLQEKIYETYIIPILNAKGKPVPSFAVLRYNASLVLGNSHVCLGQAIRLPENYKAVGGYHLGSHIEPLPRDLHKIMNNSKNGVIYFSMGSYLKSKDLPDEIKRNLLEVFGELKQTVLWKFEENLTSLPDNVHILNWAPQQSILSHANCILFITHGGLLSIIEATHYAVPIIGIPVFADQFRNVNTAVSKGFGIRVDLSYTMVDDIKAAIINMINNSSYRKTVKELSLIFLDRPVNPQAELIHWVEHVIRTRGARHLRSPAILVPWYQKIYLDLFVMMLTIILILKALLRRLFYAVKRRSIMTEKKKKDKLG